MSPLAWALAWGSSTLKGFDMIQPSDFTKIRHDILTMSESEIEIIVERVIDKLDKKLMQSKITQSEYDYEVSIIDKWSTQQYEHSKAKSV